MTLLFKLCCTLVALTLFISHIHAAGQRTLASPNSPRPRQFALPSPVLRPPRRAARQNQPVSYHSQNAQYYRPNYQPARGGNAYFDPSYEPSNYRESFNNPSANPSMTLATYPSVAAHNPTAAYSNPAPSYNVPSAFAYNNAPLAPAYSGFEPSSFDASHEPSSYQPKAVKAAFSSKKGDHDSSESRLERQGSQDGGGQDPFVDFGAHSGGKGSFGWYADFPVHKDS